MELTINQTPEAIVAILDGRLDTAASPEFAKGMMPLMDAAGQHIILDCEKLEFISSSGLRLFLTLLKNSIANNGKVPIRNVQDKVKEVFVMTGFYSLFEFA